MKFFVLLAFVGYVASQQYVWDILKPALTAAEVQSILNGANPGTDYPINNDLPADAVNYNCAAKKQPGFYADPQYQCQVFHRCDINGNLTSYLCVNTTVFNQITLVCDYYFNVDCQKFAQYEDFANSRLYTDQPLFDTPPADYVAPQSAGSQAAVSGVIQAGQRQPSRSNTASRNNNNNGQGSSRNNNNNNGQSSGSRNGQFGFVSNNHGLVQNVNTGSRNNAGKTLGNNNLPSGNFNQGQESTTQAVAQEQSTEAVASSGVGEALTQTAVALETTQASSGVGEALTQEAVALETTQASSGVGEALTVTQQAGVEPESTTQAASA